MPHDKKMPECTTGALREKMNNQPYDLIPFSEIATSYARVANYGAEKYDAWNWTKGLPRTQILGSLLRHTFAYLRGEDVDSLENGGSGLSHVDHILWNAVALCHSHEHEILDDRRAEPKRGYK